MADGMAEIANPNIHNPPLNETQYTTIQPIDQNKDYLENAPHPLDESKINGLGNSVSGALMSGSVHNSSVMTIALSNVGQARQIRQHKELEVRRMHNRIQMLQAEEEKALKRIEETREKAQQMLDNKKQQDFRERVRME